jgi:hypothetical protein
MGASTVPTMAPSTGTGTAWSWSRAGGGDGGSLIEVRAWWTQAGAADSSGCGGWSWETRDRIRAAIINSGEQWPTQPVQLELEPAVPYRSLLDAALAVAVLTATGAISGRGERPVIVGELGLDGRLRAPAVAAAAVAAAAGAAAALPASRRRIVVPAGLVSAARPPTTPSARSSARSSARPRGRRPVDVVGVESLAELLTLLRLPGQ